MKTKKLVTLTNRAAAELVSKALETGHVLTIKCPNGDFLTAGRETKAVGPAWTRYHALRWGHSRWAHPSGREVSNDVMASFVAREIVEHCGRGNAAKAARKVLG